jgi:hypothetical protein
MTTFGYEVGDQGGDERGELGVALFEVDLCSSETVMVQTDVEQRWFTETKDKYLSQNKFTETTDYQDLDRLLILELLYFRWSQHAAAGYDYQKNLVDDDLLRKQLKEQSEAIAKVKTSLGLDKRTRDAALNEGNFHAWFADAKRRAKLFGMHRENQLNKALGLMNELSSIVGTFDRSDEEERKKIGYAAEIDIVAWVRDEMLPAFHAVDEHFIENEQKMWKRDL